MQASARRKTTDNPTNCIWMEAGVIAYFLCDRNLECEGCPFDIVMRQRHVSTDERMPHPEGLPRMEEDTKAFVSMEDYTESVLNTFFTPVLNRPFPADRTYSSGHTWVKKWTEGEFLVGVDHGGVRLAGSIQSMVMPQAPVHVARGAPFSWLIVQEGAIALHAPMKGTILETNQSLTMRPELLFWDPYDEGWIVRIAGTEGSDPVQTAELHEKLVGAEILSLRQKFMKYLNKPSTLEQAASGDHIRPAGVTLLDGGTRFETLPDMIGPKAYLKLVGPLFESA